MQKVTEIETRLESLFPSSVKVCFSGAMASGVRLSTEERIGTEKMVDERLKAFGHGCDCARFFLEMLGLQRVAILRGKNRE